MSDVTAYTISSGGKIPLVEWCITNAFERAGYDHSWLVVGWGEDGELADWCSHNGIAYSPVEVEEIPEGGDTGAFLRNLYKCWNHAYEHAETKWVFRTGSDQAMSKSWLKNLMALPERYGERAVYHMTTIESPVAVHSRHDIRDWGTAWDEMDWQRFDAYANDLAHRFTNEPVVPGRYCDLWYNHPTLGQQRRPDGCSWLQTRELWAEFGPLSDSLQHGVITGDVSYMDALYDAGITGYLVRTASTYHLVRGSSREQQK